MRNSTKHIVLNLVALLAIFILAASCQHKELCYYHPHVAPMLVNVDWQNAKGHNIDGMTAHIFTQQKLDQKIETTVASHTIDKILLDLLEGSYRVAIFNGTPDEFYSLGFYNLTDYNNSSVKVVPVKEEQLSWYRQYQVKSNDEFVAHQPQWIARGLKEDLTVTKEQVEKAENEYISYGLSMDSRTINLAGEVIPDSLTCQLKLRVLIKNIDYFHKARAVVSGLSIGKHIVNMKPLNETVSHYAGLETFKFVEGSSTDGIWGEIEGYITCFGLPEGRVIGPEDVQLTIEVLLRDKITQIKVDESLKIGHLIRKEEGTNNLYMIEPIEFPKELPYVDPEDGNDAGFGVGLEEWERVEIEILGKK